MKTEKNQYFFKNIKKNLEKDLTFIEKRL